ncbi:hypothetical protein Tco_1546437 [Tanacetum coccineum]
MVRALENPLNVQLSNLDLGAMKIKKDQNNSKSIILKASLIKRRRLHKGYDWVSSLLITRDSWSASSTVDANKKVLSLIKRLLALNLRVCASPQARRMWHLFLRTLAVLMKLVLLMVLLALLAITPKKEGSSYNSTILNGFEMASGHDFHETEEVLQKDRSKGNQDSRRRSGKQEEPNALVTLDGDGVDWNSHSEDEQENYALMAYNNSGSDTERRNTEYSKSLNAVVNEPKVELLTSAKSETVNNISYINAIVAGKPVTISEASIRINLLFDDADGIDTLNNQAIFNTIYHGLYSLLQHEGRLISKLRNPKQVSKIEELHLSGDTLVVEDKGSAEKGGSTKSTDLQQSTVKPDESTVKPDESTVKPDEGTDKQDEEMARKVQEEWEAEEEKERLAEEEATTLAFTMEYNFIQQDSNADNSWRKDSRMKKKFTPSKREPSCFMIPMLAQKQISCSTKN